MGMYNKMKQVAATAAAMAMLEENGGDYTPALNPPRFPKPIVHKGDSKKCKSCKHFPCAESKTPMRMACENHERRKKK